jgi:CRP-like cAMP-binding protein
LCQAAFTEEVVEAGQMICQPGEQTDKLRVIVQGKVEVRAAAGAHAYETGRVLGVGDYFDEETWVFSPPEGSAVLLVADSVHG